VAGPYTNVNCTLRLIESRVRTQKVPSGAYGDPSNFTLMVVPVTMIATSTAQNDSGMFELSFRDERYLPFEGAGAVSTWEIEMPKDCNAFDFDTISDVVIRLSYTARDGGDDLRTAARAALWPNLTAPAASSLRQQQRMFNLRHEFFSDWRRFADSTTPQPLSITLDRQRFPYEFRGGPISITRIDFFVIQSNANGTQFAQPSDFAVKLNGISPAPQSDIPDLRYASSDDLHITVGDTTGRTSSATLQITADATETMNSIILICHYHRS
jgi:hypothetical protein